MIRRELGAVRGRGSLTTEELLTMVEPVQGILGAVVGCEFQLVEARRMGALAGTVGCWLGSATRGRRCAGVTRQRDATVEEGTISAPKEDPIGDLWPTVKDHGAGGGC